MGFRFREWKVYKDARLFRTRIKRRVLIKISKSVQFELASQLRRAITSVILNVAEGSYRSTDKDFAHFLNQAMASLYEVVACLDLVLDDGALDEKEHQELLMEAENIAKQLNGFTAKLK